VKRTVLPHKNVHHHLLLRPTANGQKFTHLNDLGYQGKRKKNTQQHPPLPPSKKKKTYLFINTMRKAKREKIEKFAA